MQETGDQVEAFGRFRQVVKLSRRSFIKLIPAVAVAVAGGSWWFLELTARESMVTSKRMPTTFVVSQATAASSSASKTGATASVALPTSSSLNAFDFPVTGNGYQPTEADLKDYRLTVDGDVTRPLELTLGELYAMPNVKKTLRIMCETGWAAEVPWEGIPLSYLLTQAGASLENIDQLTIESVHGYYIATMKSSEAANPDNMIALRVGGLPLTMEHGYPARLVAPSKLGLDWVKCVGRITCKNK
jgi:DMSO/TMAO reductase YedYZ molybdopterin-dependent catalytic subunit